MKQPDAPPWLPDILHPGKPKPSKVAADWAPAYQATLEALTPAQRQEFETWVTEWCLLAPTNLHRTRIGYEAQRAWRGYKDLPWGDHDEAIQRQYLAWTNEIAEYTYKHGVDNRILGLCRAHFVGPSEVFVFTVAGTCWDTVSPDLQAYLDARGASQTA